MSGLSQRGQWLALVMSTGTATPEQLRQARVAYDNAMSRRRQTRIENDVEEGAKVGL